MKILIASDSHRYNDGLYEAIRREAPIDMLLHCGDAEGAEYAIEMAAGCMVEIVLGNNDFFSMLPAERELDIRGKRIWMTHGHNYYVSMGTERIVDEALARGVDIALFGHTHRPLVMRQDGLMVVNPGSISFPRQEGRKPSYAVMDIDNQGEISVEIKYL